MIFAVPSRTSRRKSSRVDPSTNKGVMARFNLGKKLTETLQMFGNYVMTMHHKVKGDIALKQPVFSTKAWCYEVVNVLETGNVVLFGMTLNSQT